MDVIRASLRGLISGLRRLPGWAAILVALVAIPIWAVTIGLAGLIYEAVSRIDDRRVRRSETAKAVPAGLRWTATAGIWVMVIAILGNTSARPTDAGVPAPVAVASPGVTATPVPTPRVTNAPIATVAPTPTPEPSFGPTGATTEATVVRVVDGDTIVVAYGGQEYKVRYIGMDSPETVDPNNPVEWMGPEATAANEALVAGKTVILEKDVSETDQFDRLLRYVWLSDGGTWTLVNLELVRQGYATLDTYPPDVKYVDLIREAETSARDADGGLWGATPPPRPTPTPTPSPLVAVVDAALVAGQGDARAQFRGAIGTYTWTAVSFPEEYGILRWTVTPDNRDCRVDWSIDPPDGGAQSGSIEANAREVATGRTRFRTAFSDAEVSFESSCPKFQVSLEGETPPPAPGGGGGGGGGGGDCHPSYEGACLKVGAGDYDCASGSGNGPNYVAGPIRVVGYDEFDLDRDNDGWGCEDG